MACHQKHRKKKTNLYKLKSFTFSKTAVFFFKILLNNCKKKVHKGYPLADPCICNYKYSICNKKQPFGLTYIFFSFLPFFNCGWMVLNCDWMLFKSINKANLYKLKNFILSKTAVFNQNPMEIPSEPIRKERIYKKPWGRVQISSLLLQIWPPPKKKNRRGPFTIVDATMRH